MGQAFSTLRNHDLRLVDVAHDIISGALAAAALDCPRIAKPR